MRPEASVGECVAAHPFDLGLVERLTSAAGGNADRYRHMWCKRCRQDFVCQESASLAAPGVPFLNADEIQGSSPHFASPIAAGRELLLRLTETVERHADFAVELTLSSRQTAKRMCKWTDAGYNIILHYIELPSADYAVERVRRRVEAGGHFVPEVDVRRRFERSVVLFEGVFRPLANEWYHYYSDDSGVRLVHHSQE